MTIIVLSLQRSAATVVRLCHLPSTLPFLLLLFAVFGVAFGSLACVSGDFLLWFVWECVFPGFSSSKWGKYKWVVVPSIRHSKRIRWEFCDNASIFFPGKAYEIHQSNRSRLCPWTITWFSSVDHRRMECEADGLGAMSARPNFAYMYAIQHAVMPERMSQWAIK